MKNKLSKEALFEQVYKSAIDTVKNSEGVEYEIFLHYHDFDLPIPITHFVSNVSIDRATSYPYEQVSMTLAISHDLGNQLFSDATGRPNTGQWLQIRRPNKIFNKLGGRNENLKSTSDFIGQVTNISWGFGLNQGNGHVQSSLFNITVASFIYPLMVSQYKLSAGFLKDEGSYSITAPTSVRSAGSRVVNPDFQSNNDTSSFFIQGDQYDLFTGFIDELALEPKSIREAIHFFVDNLGYVRIPKTLTEYVTTQSFIKRFSDLRPVPTIKNELVEETGRQIVEQALVGDKPRPVLHDGTDGLRIGNFIKVATTKSDLPPSCHLRETMPDTDLEINNLNALSNTFSRGGSAWDLIKQTFQSSEMLFDLYFTWVPFNKQDLADGYKLPSVVCLSWGAIPTIVYRLKTLNPGLVPTQELLNKKINQHNSYNNKPELELPKIEYKTEIEKSTSKYLSESPYRPDNVQGFFNDIPAFPFSANNIVNITYNLSDAYRINSTYVEDPLVQKTSQVTAGVFSNPVIDANDAKYYGLRMIEIPYPFLSLSLPDTNALSERLYLIQGEGNRQFGGNITIPYPQTQEIFPGSWLSIIFDNRSSDAFVTKNQVTANRVFTCYIKSIRHDTSVDGNGNILEAVQLVYVRGTWGNLPPILPPTQNGKLVQKAEGSR